MRHKSIKGEIKHNESRGLKNGSENSKVLLPLQVPPGKIRNQVEMPGFYILINLIFRDIGL